MQDIPGPFAISGLSDLEKCRRPLSNTTPLSPSADTGATHTSVALPLMTLEQPVSVRRPLVSPREQRA
ncbi:unnamed protein product [Boreogadus saida]